MTALFLIMQFLINFIQSADLNLFHFINQSLSNPVFDWLMPIFDNARNWIIPLLIVWIVLMVKDKSNRWKLAILIPLIILLCDQTGGFIKSFELRDRPWFALGTEVVNHLGGKGGKHYSFPSNHAANITGIAIVFSYIYRKYKLIFWSFVGVISFSRVYIGVHYPADVLTGIILGCIFGFGLTTIWTMWIETRRKN